MNSQEIQGIECNKNAAHAAVASAGSGTVLLAIYGSAVVSNAAILAITTTAGLSFIVSKLPKKVQRTLVKHSLMTDAAAATATYIFLGKTVTSLLAAGIVGCLTSVVIWAAKPYILQECPEEVLVELIIE